MWKDCNKKILILRGTRGFTLIEVLIALAITIIGLVPLLHLLTTSILLTDSAWNLSQATMIGNARLAEVISRNDLEIGVEKGSVEIREKEAVFEWQLKVNEAFIQEFEGVNLTGLYEVTITVMWYEGHSPKQISLTTYVFIDNTVIKSSAI